MSRTTKPGKLSTSDIAEIRSRFKDGDPCKKIADDFGVTDATVYYHTVIKAKKDAVRKAAMKPKQIIASYSAPMIQTAVPLPSKIGNSKVAIIVTEASNAAAVISELWK